MPNSKLRFGRLKPEKIKDATWWRLVEAWENGLSDREAAFFVSKHDDTDEITAEDIRIWIKDNPEIGELKANLESDLRSTAKMNIAQAMKKHDRDGLQTARWYLERKASDEFSTKQAVAFEGAVIELSLEDKEKKLNELVEKFDPNGE